MLNALEIAKALSDAWTEKFVVRSLGELYINMERYADVIRWERYYLDIQPDSAERFNAYLNLGDAFCQLGENDSALYYLLKSSLSSDYCVKSDTYEILSKVMEKKGYLTESLRWKDSCLIYTNLSASIPRPVEAIVSLKNVISQQSIKRYKYLTQRQWYAIVLILIFGTGLFLYFMYRHKRVRLLLLTQFEKQFLKEEEKLCHKEKAIQELQDIITECESDHARMLLLNKQLDDVCVERDKLFNQLLQALPVFQKLIVLLEENQGLGASKCLIDNNTWEAIVEELNSITENFVTRLINEYPALKTSEVHFCCLLKMGFKYSDIAHLCGRTLSMMYKRRNLIIEKIKLNEKISLEEYIRLF